MIKLSYEEQQEYIDRIHKAVGATVVLEAVYGPLMREFMKHVLHHKEDSITLKALNEYTSEFKASIQSGQEEVFKKLLDEVNKIKGCYMTAIKKYCTSTTDIAELTLTEKELKLMSEDELVQFYSEVIGDDNKIRLVKLELKTRETTQPGITAAVLARYEEVLEKDRVLKFISDITVDLDRYINHLAGQWVFFEGFEIADRTNGGDVNGVWLKMGTNTTIDTFITDLKNTVYHGQGRISFDPSRYASPSN